MKIQATVLAICSVLILGAGCVDGDVDVSENSVLNEVTVSGMTFDLPEEWNVQSVEGDTAYINLPDPDYDVVMPFSVKSSDHMPSEEGLIGVSDAGFEIYSEFCAPAYGCWYIKNGEDVYIAAFEIVESDQPVPEDLDGIWFPRGGTDDETAKGVVFSAR